MTYEEIRTTYKWLTENYSGVYGVAGHTGTCIKETYHKRASRWVLAETETEDVDDRHYFNVFDAVPFFRNLGGYERVICTYTTLGYIPVESISISPDRETKIVRKFKF